jgi:hypothetical protein
VICCSTVGRGLFVPGTTSMYEVTSTAFPACTLSVGATLASNRVTVAAVGTTP